MDPSNGLLGSSRLFVSQISGGLSNLIAGGYEFLENFGWFILIGIAVGAFIWRQYIRGRESPRAPLWNREKRDEDANIVVARHEALLAARHRMQEAQNHFSVIAKEEAAKREEEKRKRKIEEWERHEEGGGYRDRTNNAQDETPSSSSGLQRRKGKPLREHESSPLNGSGGSNYRPPRKSCCSKGGCG